MPFSFVSFETKQKCKWPCVKKSLWEKLRGVGGSEGGWVVNRREKGALSEWP